MAINLAIKPGGGGDYADIVNAIIAAMRWNATGHEDFTLTAFAGNIGTSSGTVTLDVLNTYTIAAPFNLTVIADSSVASGSAVVSSAATLPFTLYIKNWGGAMNGQAGSTLNISGLRVGNGTSNGQIVVLTNSPGRVNISNIYGLDGVTRSTTTSIVSVTANDTDYEGIGSTDRAQIMVNNVIYHTSVAQPNNVYLVSVGGAASTPSNGTISGCTLDMSSMSGVLTAGIRLTGVSAALSAFHVTDNLVAGATQGAFKSANWSNMTVTGGNNASQDTTSRFISSTSYATGIASSVWPYRALGDYRTRAEAMTASCTASTATIATDIDGATKSAPIYPGAVEISSGITWHIEGDGNDATGNGSERAPFATCLPVGKTAAWEAGPTDIIDVGTGNFDQGTNCFALPGCLIQGVSASASTLTSSSIMTGDGQGVGFQFQFGGTWNSLTLNVVMTGNNYSGIGYRMQRGSGIVPIGYNASQGQLARTTTVVNDSLLIGHSDALYAWWSGSDVDDEYVENEDTVFDPPAMSWSLNNCTLQSDYDATNFACQWGLTPNTTNVTWTGLSVIINGGRIFTQGAFNTSAMARAASNYCLENFTTNNVSFVGLNGTGSFGTMGVSVSASNGPGPGLNTVVGGVIQSNSTRNADKIYDVFAGENGTVNLTGVRWNPAKVGGTGVIVNNAWAGYPLCDTIPTLVQDGSNLTFSAACAIASSYSYTINGGEAVTDNATAVSATLEGYSSLGSATLLLSFLDATGSIMAYASSVWAWAALEGLATARDRTDPTAVSVTWTAFDGAASYQISKDGAAFTATGISGTTFTDVAGSANAGHRYVVRALDADDNVIAQGVVRWSIGQRNRWHYVNTRNRGRLG